MTLKISRSQVSTQPNPTQPNPTHGWAQPMTNSDRPNAGCIDWHAVDARGYRVLQRASAPPTDAQRLSAQRSRRPSAPELDAQVEKMRPGARNSTPQLHGGVSSTTGVYSVHGH